MYKIIVKLELPSIPMSETIAKQALNTILLHTPPNYNKDWQTVLHELVNNCIAHAYPDELGIIFISMTISKNGLTLTVRDTGVGIEDVDRARMPFFTSKENLSGTGFTIIESLVDSVKVSSTPGKGTKVTVKKTFLKKF